MASADEGAVAASADWMSSEADEAGNPASSSQTTSAPLSAAERAARRRRRILEQGEDRMKKIIMGDKAKKAASHDEEDGASARAVCSHVSDGIDQASSDERAPLLEHLTNDLPSSSVARESRYSDISADVDGENANEDAQLRHRGPLTRSSNAPSLTSQDTSTSGNVGAQDAAPEPIGLTTLLKPQTDASRITLHYSLLLFIQNNLGSIATGLLLIVVAILSSLFNSNFTVPFTMTQSFRLAISGREKMDLKFLVESLENLALFIFFYIITRVIPMMC